jgi:hypothetical protein
MLTSVSRILFRTSPFLKLFLGVKYEEEMELEKK